LEISRSGQQSLMIQGKISPACHAAESYERGKATTPFRRNGKLFCSRHLVYWLTLVPSEARKALGRNRVQMNFLLAHIAGPRASWHETIFGRIMTRVVLSGERRRRSAIEQARILAGDSKRSAPVRLAGQWQATVPAGSSHRLRKRSLSPGPD